MKVKGLAAQQAGGPLLPFEFERRPLGNKDVAFKISHAGICHSDIHQVREEWGPALFPMVPGHEIVGTVTALGEGVTGFHLGQRVGVPWLGWTCGTCEYCKSACLKFYWLFLYMECWSSTAIITSSNASIKRRW